MFVEPINRPRLITGAGLVFLTALGWAYLWHDSTNMTCAMMMMPDHQEFTAGDALLLFTMWAVMMVAMMTPSVAPTVLLFTTSMRRQDRGFARAFLFLGGYLLAWTLFSAVAAAAQWGLHSAAMLAPAMTLTNPALSAGVLAAAGVFQLTPWKRACLAHCQSPLHFLITSWREGKMGALLMGLQHGAYCLGCCWLLMLVLFAVGVMNLWWVALLSALVLIEKLAPHRAVSYVAGAALILVAAWVAYPRAV